MFFEGINIEEEPFLFDKIGRVIIKDDKVYRIIIDPKHIQIYKELLNSSEINDIFSKGLVETKIHSEDIEKSILILEHKRLNFILHPCEYTNQMFWEAANMYINLCKELYNKYGLLTVDSHPWNVTFDGVNPVFYDFSSLYKGESISQSWINEFEKYFAIPIRLASFSKKTYSLALEYRREHLNGFGLVLLNKKLIKKVFNKRFGSISKYRKEPNKVFDEILIWLNNNKPIQAKNEYWSNYEQSHSAEIEKPKTIKQKFVHKILSENQPKTVLDLASNNGYYAIMANKLGASVIAFDYEEETINKCRKQTTLFNSNVTPAIMNFNTPTPPYGIGLMGKSAFERFNCDVVFALGLIHHICLRQQIPVYLFCEICLNYSNKGIILEFVDPTDVHVANWNIPIPKDYNLESVTAYFKVKFPNVIASEKILLDGINREILFFHK